MEYFGDKKLKDITTAVLDSSRIKTANLMEQILTEQTPNKHHLMNFG